MTINRNALKTYAPKARNDFIAAMIARAAKFGITKNGAAEASEQGDLVIVGSEAFPRKVGDQRKKLIARINLHGFDQTMEEVAYTWFNRLLAIRYMELHGYLDHGYRVLSHPSGKDLPEILEHAEHLELPGLDKARVVDLKLDGTKDAELYRLLLIAQCNALHHSMPFLFERIDDETELLLPDSLLHSDSLIRKLVITIDEADWQEIEIIGWLYQFYISEKKDQVIGKVVKSEDIPAATQLFTPNWIVKYMVQNSLGAQWLATYPDSPLRQEMTYYIEPAQQSDEVQKELDAITPRELNPEELTLLDPACGSGHILVEAYDLFKAVYLERGYRLRDIPRLILEKNLFGLDIDDRAAQMAGFALLMKARADDRRVLSHDKPPVMNVLAVQDSRGINADEIARALLPQSRYDLVSADDLLPETLPQRILSTEDSGSSVDSKTISGLIDLFYDAKNFGSLIKIHPRIKNALPALKELSSPNPTDDIFQERARSAIKDLVKQTNLLANSYDAVVANPPYMGGRALNAALSNFAKQNYPDSKSDLFSIFIDRGLKFINPHGMLSMITMQSWMFLSSYEKIRSKVLSNHTIASMVHLGERAFDTIGGAVVSTTSFVIRNDSFDNFIGTFIRNTEGRSEASKADILRNVSTSPAHATKFLRSNQQFEKIPGSPIAYWLSDKFYEIFDSFPTLEEVAKPRQGATTSDNQRFLRLWHEVAFENIGFHFESGIDAADSGLKWFPYNKGGEFRRWYGNQDYIINYGNDGFEIKEFHEELNKTKPGGRLKNQDFYFKPSVSWSKISTGSFATRVYPAGFIFDVAGSAVFFDDENAQLFYCGLMNSNFTRSALEALSPTLNFEAEHLCRIPIPPKDTLRKLQPSVVNATREIIEISKRDWDSYETSWGFEIFPLLSDNERTPYVEEAFNGYILRCNRQTERLKELEESSNKEIIRAYGLDEELGYDVPEERITLSGNFQYRFGSSIGLEQGRLRLRTEIGAELVSYSVGCMMGRYSLAAPGLVYAKAGNLEFDPTRYESFAADDDGIVPVTEIEWFDDDAAVRFEEFLRAAWPPETLRENLRFVAESLASDGGSDPENAIRSYFSKSFFKDHLKTYKKRPIYWLFSSGKLKAFECLVYLHRYNEGTLSRMRMEYVTPLQSRMAGRIEQLAGDIESASSSAARNKAQKERDLMVAQLEELRTFDEELRHFADQRITLDLDDGVKVNYGKFGNLLAERKAITGEK